MTNERCGPSYEELMVLLGTMTKAEIARKYGVSRQRVNQWAKRSPKQTGRPHLRSPLETQSSIFDYIIQYKRDNDGDTPSYKDIAEAVGLKSVSGIQGCLAELEKAGLIRRYGPYKKGVFVTGGQWTYTPPESGETK